MSLSALLGFVGRWWLLLLLGPIVAGVAGYAYVLQVPPVYQATTTILVSRGAPAGSTGIDDSVGAESLARTYAEAVRTRPVLEEAAQRVGASMSVRDLQSAVTVRTVTGTQLLRVLVEDRDPARAADLANSIVAVFSERNLEMQASRYAASRDNLERLVNTLQNEIDNRSAELQQLRATLPAGDPQLVRLESEFAQVQAAYGETVRTFENLRVAEARGLNGFTVVEPAIAPADPVRPSKLQAVALAVIAGLLVAAGLARTFEYLDDGLRTRERLATKTGLRALGVIPRWRSDKVGALVSQIAAGPNTDRETRRAAEGYRLLLNTVMLAHEEVEGSSTALMVASAVTEEGKSVTAANLAMVLAEAGRKVILVDADVHRPAQARMFQLKNRGGGLSTLLLNGSSAVDSLLQGTRTPGLRVLPAGPAPSSPSALFASQRLSARLAELKQHCEVLLIDTPPVLAEPDAALIGRHVDGVLFVVDARKSRGRLVRRALLALGESGSKVLGAALNRVPPQSLDYVQYGYAEQAETQAVEGGTSASTGVVQVARQKAL